MSSSFGPVNTGRRPHGRCIECWDENWSRATAGFFESRVRMVGRVCKHRLVKPARKSMMKQFRLNAYYQEILRNPKFEDQKSYWYRRAMLPDYCGEPGELVLGTENNLRCRITKDGL